MAAKIPRRCSKCDRRVNVHTDPYRMFDVRVGTAVETVLYCPDCDPQRANPAPPTS